MTIVMVHALVPHTHIPVTAYAENTAFHENAESFLDFLQLTFHHETQDGEMEVFQMADEVNPQFQPALLATLLRIVYNFVPKESNNAQPIDGELDSSATLLFASALSRRGPPSKLV